MKNNKDDNKVKCSHCGRDFDLNNEGHQDEETNLAFCWADCEMVYDREVGLPDNYKQA